MPRLSPDQVGFLSFEGGGRAGLVIHPGVAQALGELRILRYDDHGRQVGVQGFAGSSSGSLMATLLSCGYTFQELFGFLSEPAFDLVFKAEPFALGQFYKPVDVCTPADPSRGGPGLPGPIPAIISAKVRELLDDPMGLVLDGLMVSQSNLQAALGHPLLTALATQLELGTLITHAVSVPVIPSWLLEQARTMTDELKQKVAPAAAIGAGELSSFVEQNYPTAVSRLVQQLTDPDPATSAARNPNNAYNILKNDFGVFPGCEWHSYLDHLVTFARFRVRYGVVLPTLRAPTEQDFLAHSTIAQVFSNRITEAARDYDGGKGTNPPDFHDEFGRMRNTTFQQHREELYPGHTSSGPPPLAISGANLSTQESHLFSSLTTPWLCVADAVRMATSLPPLFKPVVIEPKDVPPTWPRVLDSFADQHFMVGYWVDGGVFWNSPFDSFNQWQTSSRRTLGIGIGIGKRKQIDDVTDFYTSMINVVYERNISATRINIEQFMVLDNHGILVTGRRMSATELAFYRAYGRWAGYTYFDLEAPPP
jgi:predicted acylesterase/phospholipase RssA